MLDFKSVFQLVVLTSNGVVVTTGLVEKCDVTNTDALDVQAAAAVILNADGVYMASISALLLALKLASNGYYTTRDPAKLPFNEVSFNSASYWHSKYHLEKQLSVLSCWVVFKTLDFKNTNLWNVDSIKHIA